MRRAFALVTCILLECAAVSRGSLGWQQVKDRFDTKHGSKHYEMSLATTVQGIERMELSFEAFGEAFTVLLEQDRSIVGKDFSHVVVGRDGARRLVHEDMTCIYRVVEDKRVSGYASNCGNSFSAFVESKVSGRSLRILTVEDFRPHRMASGDLKVMVYDDGIDIDEEWTCGHQDTKSRHDVHTTALIHDAGKSGERRLDTIVGNQIKFIKMLIVNDKERYDMFGDNTHAVTLTLLDMVQKDLLSKFNEMSLYKLEIEIVGMISFSHGDPWGALPKSSTGEVDQHQLLGEFNTWRSEQLRLFGVPDHGVAHLLSGKRFNGTVVGVANVNTLCKNNAATGVVQAVDFTQETIAAIVAHELMHNLGAQHTTDSIPGTLVPEPCGKGFIMHPSGIKEKAWSTCTVNWLTMAFGTDRYPLGCSSGDCKFFPSYYTRNCAETRAKQTYTLSPSCGNGVRDPGEECDCGAEECGNIDPCCNGLTCKLHEDAVCSGDDACCDANTCKPVSKSAQRSCRQALSAECDSEEFCDGVSATCPQNVFAGTGATCGVNGACYAGECNELDKQCRDINPDFTACPSAQLFGDEACGVLFCKRTGNDQCFSVRMNDEDDVMHHVADGTPCVFEPSDPKNKGMCHNMRCLNNSDVPFPVGITCSNGIQDELETDVDCGGPSCFPCLPLEKCISDSDCFGTEDQPGRCDRPTTAPTAAPTIARFSRPIGKTCKDIATKDTCGSYTGCVWLEKYSSCKETGWFPDEVSASCTPKSYDASCCSGRTLEETCINWIYCGWDSDASACVLNPPSTASPTTQAPTTSEAAFGVCREYTSGTGDEEDEKPSFISPFLAFWSGIKSHLPLVVLGTGGAIFIGACAGFFVCFRQCKRPDPRYGDVDRKRRGHAYRSRLSTVSSGSNSTDSPRALGAHGATVAASSGHEATLAAAAAAAVAASQSQLPRRSSFSRRTRRESPGTAANVTVPVTSPEPSPTPGLRANVPPCSYCHINYSNPLNVDGRCNSCNNAARAMASPVRYVSQQANRPSLVSFAPTPTAPRQLDNSAASAPTQASSVARQPQPSAPPTVSHPVTVTATAVTASSSSSSSSPTDDADIVMAVPVSQVGIAHQ